MQPMRPLVPQLNALMNFSQAAGIRIVPTHDDSYTLQTFKGHVPDPDMIKCTWGNMNRSVFEEQPPQEISQFPTDTGTRAINSFAKKAFLYTWKSIVDQLEQNAETAYASMSIVDKKQFLTLKLQQMMDLEILPRMPVMQFNLLAAREFKERLKKEGVRHVGDLFLKSVRYYKGDEDIDVEALKDQADRFVQVVDLSSGSIEDPIYLENVLFDSFGIAFSILAEETKRGESLMGLFSSPPTAKDLDLMLLPVRKGFIKSRAMSSFIKKFVASGDIGGSLFLSPTLNQSVIEDETHREAVSELKSRLNRHDVPPVGDLFLTAIECYAGGQVDIDCLNRGIQKFAQAFSIREGSVKDKSYLKSMLDELRFALDTLAVKKTDTLDLEDFFSIPILTQQDVDQMLSPIRSELIKEVPNGFFVKLSAMADAQFKTKSPKAEKPSVRLAPRKTDVFRPVRRLAPAEI